MILSELLFKICKLKSLITVININYCKVSHHCSSNSKSVAIYNLDHTNYKATISIVNIRIFTFFFHLLIIVYLL